MIDAAVRTELRYAKKARALHVGLTLVRSLARNEGQERQAREIIPGQEALGSQVSIGVKVGANRFASREQEADLTLRHILQSFRTASDLRIAYSEIINGASRFIALRFSGRQQITPGAEYI